jgi:hypothetical protein
LVHKSLTSADLGRSDLGIRTIATFCYRFNGRKVLVVSIAVAEEKERFETSSIA